ncbi:MAG: sigma-54 dependent transcriptional regulator [Candidatus Poribacteria bacterium]|nr:sigma-54 dependent transcriptional regulator [Candidatus Poribacteria bacterium]
MATKRVLICDDEPNLCFILTHALRPLGVETTTAHTLADATDALRQGNIDVMFLDIFLPDGNGLDRLPKFREEYPLIPIIVLTAHGTMRTALEAMKRHAFDYITKPFDVTKVQELARRALLAVERQAAESSEPTAPPKVGDGDEMIGNSGLMQEVFKTVGRVAESDVTVLIQGEGGTGKELVARAIHMNSHRATGPFVPVNCAAIPETLLESELFGHVRGAFTNAVADRKGRFEQASGGTLFLDEIGEMPFDVQSKLLRVLQERTFQPVGSNETRVTDARIITATNRDLARAADEGDFREDLLYRLNVVTVTLPPLRKRMDDVPSLTEYFVSKYCARYNRDPVTVSKSLAERLYKYHWPGNVRELENVIHRAVVMARGNILTEEDVPLLSPPPETERGESIELWLRRLTQKHVDDGRVGELHDEALAGVEIPLFRLVLEQTSGNKSRAADILGINRNTLHAKMKRYEMLDSDGSEDDS